MDMIVFENSFRMWLIDVRLSMGFSYSDGSDNIIGCWIYNVDSNKLLVAES